MTVRHRLLAMVVAACWGLNFIAIDASLAHFPPFFLVALRFAVLAVPTILLVPRPRVPLRWLVGYGLGFGVFQFLFLYWGMDAGMPAGLASLVLQASAPFTVVLGALFLRERMRPAAVLGLLIACGGLGIVGLARADAAAGALPFLLVLAGALAWAVGNLCTAQAHAPNPLHLALWMSVVPPLPMLGLSLAVEGPERILSSLASWGAPTALPAILGLAYTVLIGSVAGSGLWSSLMTTYGSSAIAPFSMLVPVVGMSAAWLLLGERITLAEGVGAAAVVAGVLIATHAAGSRGGADAPRPPAVLAADASRAFGGHRPVKGAGA
jgi:O-acetylserine/cysteine efflux transporter